MWDDIEEVVGCSLEEGSHQKWTMLASDLRFQSPEPWEMNFYFVLTIKSINKIYDTLLSSPSWDRHLLWKSLLGKVKFEGLIDYRVQAHKRLNVLMEWISLQTFSLSPEFPFWIGLLTSHSIPLLLKRLCSKRIYLICSLEKLILFTVLNIHFSPLRMVYKSEIMGLQIRIHNSICYK